MQIYTATHTMDYLERRNWTAYNKPVRIGDDCWIGGGAIICPGVTIGPRSIIGAGAVVTRDIPADSLAVGNPARVIRTLTTGRDSGSGVPVMMALPCCLWVGQAGSARTMPTGGRWPLILLMSLLTLVVYAWDKRQAIRGGWRVPEARLHLLELCGGWPGALVARQWLRHKTQKGELPPAVLGHRLGAVAAARDLARLAALAALNNQAGIAAQGRV